jgi:hypothetical protein
MIDCKIGISLPILSWIVPSANLHLPGFVDDLV